ncbi:hypothetical protein BGM09_11025 [Streptomyces sp. CBMA29]|nr:hypothetical protein [Streptomyces sp. CBMA29]MBD0739946.1 hypothetical protein [Streptomyces sp. CBMA29]
MSTPETVDLRVYARAYGEDFTADPYPVYARLRERGPVHHVRTADTGAMWLVVGPAVLTWRPGLLIRGVHRLPVSF